MLVLCSRNARPEKGLVRRAHVAQHGCPFKRGEPSKREREQESRPSFLLAQRAASVSPRWTRAVKDSPATLLKRGSESSTARESCGGPLIQN